MSFIKKMPEPPDVKEHQIVKAKIVNLEFPIQSQYKDSQNNPKLQIRFNCILEKEGFTFPCWMAFYERPSEGSHLGQLCKALIDLTKIEYRSVTEALTDLEKIGAVYAQCIGFREFQGKYYPKFKIVPTKLPPLQTELPSLNQKGPTEETLSFIRNSKEMIVMGIPMNEADWNSHVPAAIRTELLKLNLIEQKEDLYFFSEKAQKFL